MVPCSLPYMVIGAGEGNRTLVISLEGCCSTIELHPRRWSVIRGSYHGPTTRHRKAVEPLAFLIPDP